MKLQLLPSSFQTDGSASGLQHLTSFLIDGRIAIDAGSLALSLTSEERKRIRDIVLTHSHLDHIAALPLFIDDQFSEIREPIRVFASPAVIDVLESHIFNWLVYPKFSELENSYGKVVEYHPINDKPFYINDLQISPLPVNHKVPSYGFVLQDSASAVAITGDTADMDEFWVKLSDFENLAALLIECAFPDELSELATMSHHLTPSRLAAELDKFHLPRCPVYVINMKPAYQERISQQLESLGIERLKRLEVGKNYEF